MLLKDGSDVLSLTLCSAYQKKNSKARNVESIFISSFTYKPVWLIINVLQMLNVTILKLFAVVTEQSSGKLQCDTLGLNNIIKTSQIFFLM